MSILLKPTLGCNLKCRYCYEQDIRANEPIEIDIDAITNTVKEVYTRDCKGSSICVHGGEALTLPKQDLEKLLKCAFEEAGYSSIQTNGTLMDDDHIAMFKQYKTGVGISIDGRWPLNELRWAGSDAKTKEMTEKTISSIYRLLENGIFPGMIAVISKANGTEDRISQLKGFLQEMHNAGVTSARLNLAISEKWGLTSDEAKTAYLELCEYTLADPKRMYQPFRDMVDNLLGLGMGTCVFTKCDFYHTTAGHAILGDGSETCCLKTAGNGRPFVWDSQYSDVRYQALQSIPREEGGCGGCRYWRVCYGFCPSETSGGDWRNRAIYCEAYHACWEYIEKRLKGLLPNVTLVTDTTPQDEQADYMERSGNRWSTEAFRTMTSAASNPSTWRQNICSSKHGSQQPSQNERDRLFAQPVPGKPGHFHADHADQGGRK